MQELSTEVVGLLAYLLPGFLAAAVFHSLTPWPKGPPFERVVNALIYTITVQALVICLQWTFSAVGTRTGYLGAWTDDARLVSSVFIALALGLLLAAASNHDWLHRFLRRCRLTHMTAYASEWFGVLSHNSSYVVLHLNGQRRLYGWAEEWPSAADRGHFVMVLAEWLDGEERISLPPSSRVIIRATDVEMVELVPLVPVTESANG